MRLKILLASIVLLVFLGAWAGQKVLKEDAKDSNPVPAQGYQRIVSLAPSITEMLFALGAGDRVVGVTKYCDYPPEALTRQPVGGYYDPNYEAIVLLEPDLVLLLPEHEAAKENLHKLGIKTIAAGNDSIADILASLRIVGEVCGAPKQADLMIQDMRRRMVRIEKATSGLARPRVLICIGRNMSHDSLDELYVAGKAGFFSELTRLAGGVNAYEGDMAFPVLSPEGVMRINPDVLVDLVPDLQKQGLDPDAIRAEWKHLTHVKAVEEDRVYVFGEGHMVIPGPRFILILEAFVKVFHPEVEF